MTSVGNPIHDHHQRIPKPKTLFFKDFLKDFRSKTAHEVK